MRNNSARKAKEEKNTNAMKKRAGGNPLTVVAKSKASAVHVAARNSSNPVKDKSHVRELTNPTAFAKNVHALAEEMHSLERQYADKANNVFARLYRNAVIAKAYPDVLAHLMRDEYWSESRRRPDHSSVESIFQSFVRYVMRKKDGSSARSAIHTWTSAGKELLARNVKPEGVKNALSEEPGGIGGLRDAFKKRRRTSDEDAAPKSTERKREGQKKRIRTPLPSIYQEDIFVHRYEEDYVVIKNVGYGTIYIPMDYIKKAKRK